jgi:hypothetical protein
MVMRALLGSYHQTLLCVFAEAITVTHVRDEYGHLHAEPSFEKYASRRSEDAGVHLRRRVSGGAPGAYRAALLALLGMSFC